MKKITEQANNLDLQVEVVEHEDGPEDGCMYSVTLSIEGENITKLSEE
jgi:protein subunit release factor B